MNPNERVVRTVVATLSPGASPNVLVSAARRESNWHADAVGDVEIARDVFLRDRAKLAANGSPYTSDADIAAWSGSFGLFQLMAPYEVQRWRKDAHPSVLLNPIVSTILAMRKVNRIIDLGAQNAVDIRMVWAFGPDGLDIPHDDDRYVQRVESETKRWRDLGLSGSPLDPVRKFQGVGTGPTNDQAAQVARLTSILGGKLPGGETNTTPATKRPSVWPLVAVGAVGVVAYFAWQTSKTSRAVPVLTS